MDYEMDPPEKVYTTVHDRYLLTHDDPGLIATTQTKMDALRQAAHYANRENVPVVVYDRMARIGKAQSWVVHPGIDPESPRIILPAASVRSEKEEPTNG